MIVHTGMESGSADSAATWKQIELDYFWLVHLLTILRLVLLQISPASSHSIPALYNVEALEIWMAFGTTVATIVIFALFQRNMKHRSAHCTDVPTEASRVRFPRHVPPPSELLSAWIINYLGPRYQSSLYPVSFHFG
jgi:hypothetical protein